MSDAVGRAGVVRSVAAGEALVAVAVQGCSSCGQRKACGVGKLAGHGRTALVRVVACDGVKAGDAVTVHAAQGAVNRAAVLAYLLPALSIVIGTVAGDRLARSDAAAVLGAGLGVVFGVALTRIIAQRFRGVAAPLSLQRRD